MTFLLDTQVALWWLAGAPRLAGEARTLIAESPCAISVASIWEVDLKHGTGKLPIPALRFRDEMVSAGADIIPITDAHVLADIQLAPPHRDPFDRIMVRVAAVERLTLLTADKSLIRLWHENPHLPIRGV
jgi:PIN domain nuclease of toxin-antitoxin system